MKKLVSLFLAVVMVITLIPASAMAESLEESLLTQENVDQVRSQDEMLETNILSKKGHIILKQNNSEGISMCNQFFAEEVDMTEKGDTVTLKMYVAYLEPFDREKTGATINDFVVTFEGKEYIGVSDTLTKTPMHPRETNPAFGLDKEKEMPSQIITIDIPKAALAAKHIDGKASVVAMGGNVAEFDIVISDKVAAEPEIKEETKDTIYEIRVGTGASGLNEFYVFQVNVYKYGNVITEIIDKTGSLSGQYNLMLGQYIDGNGLSQYTFKTFKEVKEMKRPDPMKTMAGSYDEMPGNIHDELVKLIGKIESEQQDGEKTKKTDLAKAVLQYAADYKNSDYTADTLEPFNKAYEQAKQILEGKETEETAIKEALDNLNARKEQLKGVPLDYGKLDEKILVADKIMENQQDYDIEPLMNLKKILPLAKAMKKDGAKVKSELDEMVSKLETAIGNITRKSPDAKLYYIQGQLDSMANGFLNPQILLEEKDGKAIYTIELNKEAAQKYVRHIQDGKKIDAIQVAGTEEFPNRFRIVRNKLSEEKIELVMFPILMGVEKSSNLELQLSTKRPINSQENKDEVNKLRKELEELLSSEGSTFDKATATEFYGELGAKEYVKAYDAAIREKNNIHGTEESLKKAMADLVKSRDNDLTFTRAYIGKYKTEIENLGNEAKEKLENKHNYTESSFVELERAYGAYAKVTPPVTFNKILLARISAGETIKILTDLNSAVKGLEEIQEEKETERKIEGSTGTPTVPSTPSYFLKDGNYYVKMNLWQKNTDAESMGKLAFQEYPNALVTVSGGKITNVEIGINPVSFMSIYTGLTKLTVEGSSVTNLETVNIKDSTGEKRVHVGRARFTLPESAVPKDDNTVTYANVTIEAPPAMGETSARLKFTWATRTETTDTHIRYVTPVQPEIQMPGGTSDGTEQAPDEKKPEEQKTEEQKPEVKPEEKPELKPEVKPEEKPDIKQDTTVEVVRPKAPNKIVSKISKAKDGYNDIVTTWTKVDGATGYFVYSRRPEATQKWTFIGKTDKTIYTRKNLKSGVKYQFKVVPYVTVDGKNYTAEGGKVAAATTLSKLKIPTIKRENKTEIRINWNNILGETGYQISKSKKANGVNVIKTVKTTTGKTTVVKAPKGNKFYYKVRAYKVVDGKKVFSPWSKVRLFG